MAMDSQIVKAQKDSDKNVMTMEDLDAETKSSFLSYLAATPLRIW